MSQTIFIVLVATYALLILTVPLIYTAWSFRVVYLSGYHRLIFTDEDAQITSVLIRLPEDATEVTLSHGTYSLHNVAVRYMGRFRIPTYEYLKGISEPLIINPEKFDLSDKTQSSDFERVAKNRAMEQLLAAMAQGIMNPVNIMALGFVILGIIIIAANGYLISEIQSIAEATEAR